MVIDLCGGEAQLRDEPTQVEVALGIGGQSTEGGLAQQAKVRMVVHRPYPHRTLQAVEGERGRTLQPGISLAGLLHAVDDVVALPVAVDHRLDSGEVVLQVGIDRDDGIGLLHDLEHPRHDGGLMAYIAR